MKRYECAVDINLPLEKVVALFNDPANFQYWQDGFVSYQTINGQPRTTGAISIITFLNKKEPLVLTETIQSMKLPVQMTALYEHEHGSNTMTNTFMELPGNKTRYIAEIGNAKGYGLIPKLVIVAMFSVYKRHNQKWLNQFKKFAESTATVPNL